MPAPSHINMPGIKPKPDSGHIRHRVAFGSQNQAAESRGPKRAHALITVCHALVTRLSRADEIKHLRNALLAEFDGLLATTVDDDAGHAHCAVLVLKLRKMRNVVGLGAHGRV